MFKQRIVKNASMPNSKSIIETYNKFMNTIEDIVSNITTEFQW